MACKGCGKNRSSISQSLYAEKGVDFLQHIPATGQIKGIDGKIHSISSPLTVNRPRGGWSVDVRINNNSLHVTGKNGTEIYNVVKELYDTNGITIDPETIWYNLNLQWVASGQPKYSKVRIEDLRAIAFENEPEAESYGPADWGSKGWGIIQLYLAKSTYDQAEFRKLAYIVRGILADEEIGCDDCLEHFDSELAEHFESLESQNAARLWVFNLMNDIRRSLGKNEFTWEQAIAVNHWT